MANGFSCSGAGYNKSEHDGIYFRWTGADYLLLYFSSPALVAGAETAPNAMLVYGPNETRDYGSCGGFVNSYCTFSLPAESFDGFGLKTGTVFYPDNFSTINKLLKKITEERAFSRPLSESMIYALVLQLLAETARGQISAEEPRAGKEQQRKRRFEEIREEYLSDLVNPPEIKELISEEFFSPSQFYRLYKKYFSVTPNEDLLRARLDYAKDLMLKTELSTAEIAAMTGFKTPLNLYRCFGKRSDCTLKEWKRAAKKGE